MGNRMGVLYVVATPLGNLEDITLRALRLLREARLIAAEDTRTVRKLLARYDLHTPLLSYYEENRNKRIPQILGALAEGDVALVSEAGTPGLSDPGAELVQAAVTSGFRVIPAPGPAAVAAALSVSGMPGDRFLFLGFLPRRSKERRELLGKVADQPWPLILYEAPHRLRETLEDARAVLGDRQVVVAREMTKLHEELFRGSLSEALAHFTELRGEFTLVVEGAPRSESQEEKLEREAEAARIVERLMAEGVSRSEAVRRAAQETGAPRSRLYRWALQGQSGKAPR